MGNLPFDLEIEDISALADIINEKQLGEICLEDEDIGAKLIIKSRPCPPPPPMGQPPMAQTQSVPPMMMSQPPQIMGQPMGQPMTAQPPMPHMGQEMQAPAATGAAFPAGNTVLAGTEVKAPLVGIYYGSPSPDKPPFVQEGSRVRKGDILMIIESMKIMNEIPSPCDGTVRSILVRNGEAVEYDQTLMIIG